MRLDKELCKGCTNCLMHCPTEAIRVRKRPRAYHGRALHRLRRVHPHLRLPRQGGHHRSAGSAIHGFPNTIALPAPSLYGQFRGLTDVGVVLDALKAIGFEDVFEVARGADIVSRAIHEKLREPGLPRPLISSACPTVVRLIQVRFPDLIPNIVDIRQPMEVAASIARAEFCRKHDCAPEDVGCSSSRPAPPR